MPLGVLLLSGGTIPLRMYEFVSVNPELQPDNFPEISKY